jgi:hypothetical protein
MASDMTQASYAHIVGGRTNWILPIPSNLSYDSDYQWSEEDLGHQGEFTSNMLSSIFEDSSNGGLSATSKFFNMGKELFRSLGNKAIGETAVKEVLKSAGKSYNPNKQLYFNEVTMREFSVTFSLAPMSMNDANNIRTAFRSLVYSAAPDVASDSFFFTYPSMFNFMVYTNGTKLLERNNLAITAVNLDLASDGNLTWHQDGFPTALQLSVSFKESTIPTRANLRNITLFGQTLG